MKEASPGPEPQPKAEPEPEPKAEAGLEPHPEPTSKAMPEPVTSAPANKFEPAKKDSAKAKKKPGGASQQRGGGSKGGKRKSGKKKKDVGDHSVASADSDVPAAEAPTTTAFRRTSLVRPSPTKNNDWEGFSRKKELEEIDRAEKKAFYLKMKRDSGRMGSKAAAALLGGGDGGDDVSLDSDDDWVEKLEGVDVDALFAADPLDRKRKKVSVFQTLHSEDMERKYVGRRRGGEMRQKVRGKSYLLKEAHLHEEFVLVKRKGDEEVEEEEEEEEEEEVDVNVGGEKQEKGEEKKEKEEKDVIMSPEKVTLPPLV